MDMPGVEFGDNAFWFNDVSSAAAQFYGDCTPEDQQWAFEHLQPQSLVPVSTPIHLDAFWRLTTPRSFISAQPTRRWPPTRPKPP